MTQPVDISEQWVAIQANPIAGSGQQAAQLEGLISSLHNFGVRPLLFEDRDKLRSALDNPRMCNSLRCIVAAGGDGTVGDVLNRYPVRRIAILPLGTENLLAKYLDIPASGRAVAEMIVRGNTKTIDLAMLGERRFSLMASVGFDAEVVQRMDAIRSGPIWRGSYVKPIWQTLRSYRYPSIRLRVDDDETVYPAKLAMIVNINAYALGIQPAKSACDDDGLLDIRLFERGSTFQMIRYFLKVFFGSHESLSDVKQLRAKRIYIESDFPVAIQVDGDPAGVTPAEIHVLPAACEVFVP